MSMSVDSNHNWHTNLVSQASGGSIGALICFPFEAIKKKIQTGDIKTTPHLVKFVCIPRELYRGGTAFAVSVMAATVASMTFKDAFHSLPYGDHSSWEFQAVSSITAGMLGAVVGSTPVENTILVQQKRSLGPIAAVKFMLKQAYNRPWKGLPELAMREAGFAGVMLWGAEAARHKTLDYTSSEYWAQAAKIGAGALGAAATQPFDTLATYKQEQDLIYHTRVSSLQAVRNLYLQGGLPRFFRGLSGRAPLFIGCAMLIPRIQAPTQRWLEQL